MSPRLYWRLMARESRGSRGRLAFFALCLAVGVAAVVAVAGLASGVEEGIRRESKQLLAADLAIASRQPLPTEVDAALEALPGLLQTEVRELVTVVAAPAEGDRPGRSQLVELKAVGTLYPFYGRLRLEPDRPLADLLADDAAVVAPDLLSRLGLRPGESLLIGGQEFRVAGTVAGEPDRLGSALSAGPRVFLSLAGLARTGLERFGSRIEHRRLVRLAPGSSSAEISAVAEGLRQAGPEPGRYRVETSDDAQPGLRRGIERVERYLGLVALLSLLVGGVGVAQTVRAWLAGRLDTIAVLRCLGLSPREVFTLYLGESALLGVAGSLLGGVAGLAILALAPAVVGDLLPPGLIRVWQPVAVLRGVALGTGIALFFSLPPLLAVRRVPPARVLRRDAEPLPPQRVLQVAAATALLAGVWGAAAIQARSLLLGAQFAAGVAVAAALLALAAVLLVRAVSRLPRDFGGLSLRYGLAALARPGAATAGAIVALGLGVLVVLGMSLVESRLGEELDRQLPFDAPTAFLIDVQTDQWEEVREILEREGARSISSVPVISARLTSIAGESIAEVAGEEESRRNRWALTREQRLTYLETLPADNEIIAGELWSDPERPEVSVEESFARDLGVELGAVLAFEVQGVPIEVTVTSIRRVVWESFGINFYLVVEPGVLEEAPQFRLAAARLPVAAEQSIQDLLAERFPNVTLLRTREVLAKIRGILGRLAAGVRLLGGFTVLAGAVILAGAVAAGALHRAREVALLKTLGLTPAGVVGLAATEYSLVGLVAGLIGTAGGVILAWLVTTRGLDLPFPLPLVRPAIALAATVLLAVVAGVGVSWRALREPPQRVLAGD